MYGSNHYNKLALFPLCDARGILMEALLDTSDSPATRGDALVFAWRLELPDGMSVGQAADAVLHVAMSLPRANWSRRQLLIIRELMVLAGRKEGLPKPRPTSVLKRCVATAKPVRKASVSRHKPSGDEPLISSEDSTTSTTAKENKEWWTLVGKQDDVDGQRKTRGKRVSRDPKSSCDA